MDRLRTALTFDDLGPEHIPYKMLGDMLALLEELNVFGTLFVIPRGVPHGGYQRLLGRARAHGHEIALHGYCHTDNEFGYTIPIPFPRFEQQMRLLTKGKELLERSVGEAPIGFRAPSYNHSYVTLRALASSGFKYDSSKTVFKPTHGMRFRFKTFVMPKVTKLATVLEIPVTADYTYNICSANFERLLRQAIKDSNWVRTLGADSVFVVNSHAHRFGQLGFKFLRALIKELRVKSDFVRLRDLT